MLAPIPSRMLHDTVTFKVVKGMDRYQNKEYDEYTVKTCIYSHQTKYINVQTTPRYS